jgi:hypothetical protein
MHLTVTSVVSWDKAIRLPQMEKDIVSNKTYPDNETAIPIQSSEHDLCLPHTYTGTQGMFNVYA